jgi:hypothetical protein
LNECRNHSAQLALADNGNGVDKGRGNDRRMVDKRGKLDSHGELLRMMEHCMMKLKIELTVVGLLM